MKRKTSNKWHTAANVVVGTILVSIWAGVWVITFPFLHVDKMITKGIEPWQGAMVLLPASALLLYSFLHMSDVRRPLRWTAVTYGAIALLAGGQYAMSDRALAAKAVDSAFVTAEFVRERDGKTQTLAFIGQQHFAGLAHLTELDREIGRLTKQGATFYYEDTDAFVGLPEVDMLTYGLPVARFYIDLVRQEDGGLWPSSNPRMWRRWDLGKEDGEVVEARKGDEEGAKCRIHLKRDEHLLAGIGGYEGERLAVVYGLDHLANLHGRLLAQGWRETSIRVLPAGRKPLDLGGYCDTDLDLSRLEPFAAKTGAKISPPLPRP